MAIEISVRVAKFCFFGNVSNENVDMQHAIFVCFLQFYYMFLLDFGSRMYLKKYEEKNLCNIYYILASLMLLFPRQYYKVNFDTGISPSGKS